MNVKALLIVLSTIASFACAAARHGPVPASAPVQALPAPTLSPAAAAASAVVSATAPLPSDDVIALYDRAGKLAHGAAAAASAPDDIAQATALYRQAAEQGFAPAAYQLGMSYLEGRGVVRDPLKARSWFETAAQGGQAAAMAALAMMANAGQSQPVDHALAWEWYRAIATSAHDQRLTGVRSLVSVYRNPNPSPYLPYFRKLFELADGGNARAQDELGYLITLGDGFPVDRVEALRLYRAAAAKGDASALFDLAKTYAKGAGVAADPLAADSLCLISVGRGLAQASPECSQMAISLTPPQRDHAQALAAGWQPGEPLPGESAAR